MLDPNTRRSYAALVAAAFADGQLSDEERLILHRKATEMNVPIRDMNEMIEQGQRGQISVGVPTSTREREELLASMIEIVCADGRVEAPEHHLLAKYAGHLQLPLPDLRQRIREQMQKRGPAAPKIEPRIAETRVEPQAPRAPRPAPPEIRLPEPPPPPPAPAISSNGPSPRPLPAVGPVQLDGPKLVDPKIGDLPPVTLQLVKQALAFQSEEDARRQVERMLGVPREEAERILRAVLAAFPDLKASAPPSSSPRPRR